MKNLEVMTLKMSHADLCDVRLALEATVTLLKDELKNEGLNEDRKAAVELAAVKWERLYNEVARQIDEQEKKQ